MWGRDLEGKVYIMNTAAAQTFVSTDSSPKVTGYGGVVDGIPVDEEVVVDKEKAV